MSSSQLDNTNSNHSSSTNDGTHTIADVLLYAQSKLTRKQAVREIADVVLKSNMKPKTVKHALNLLKVLLPPENTLPSTVDELFGAMLSSENDWRLAQYLIKHKQRPSFMSSSSSPNIWSESSNSTNSLLLTSSTSIIPRNPTVRSPSLFLPINSGNSSSDDDDDDSNSSSSSSSSSSNSGNSDENESESGSESSSSSASESSDNENDSNDDDDDDDDDEDERNILRALHEAQQQRFINSPSIRSSTESAVVEPNLNPLTSNSSLITTLNHDTSDQRSQIVSSSINRFPFLGSFKRQRSETSSDESGSESGVFFCSTRLSNHQEGDDDDDDSDNETPFYPISNNNINNTNNKSCCFEMNGCDLLDGGKRRRH